MARYEFSLAGKIAIVTGGNSGIGSGIAEALGAAGANVSLVARDESRLAAAAERVQLTGAKVTIVPVDITEDGAPARIVQQTLEEFGEITTLVNAAGVFELAPFEASLEKLDSQWNTNVRAAFSLTQAVLPHLRPNGSALFMSSIAGSIGFATASSYCATKGAIEQLMRALAVEEAPRGVRVNALTPGNIRTPMNEHLLAEPDYEAAMLGMTPLGRIGEVGDVAPAAVFLSSDEASYITGHSLVIDGGWLAQ